MWTKDNKEALEKWWNDGNSDDEIAKYFGTTAIAIAKQRSILGLVKFKKAKHTRGAKTVKPPIELVNHVGYYRVDDMDHYINLGPDEKTAEEVAHQVMSRNGIKEIVILKPVSKLVMQHFTKIKL